MSRPGVALLVQARMTSTRLPGKVALPLAGEPALARMLERLARVRFADHLVVATSTDPSDDPVAAIAARSGAAVSRGSLQDVLARMVAAIPPGAEIVVRLTADCPLVDPELVDRHVARFLAEAPRAGYVSNALVRTFPDGLDVEVTTRAWLERAAAEATDPGDREHVTPWIRRHAPGVPVVQRHDLSALRWTLDTPADYAAIGAIFDALYPVDPAFGAREVYRLLVQRPELILVAGAAPTPAERAAWAARIRTHLSQDTP